MPAGGPGQPQPTDEESEAQAREGIGPESNPDLTESQVPGSPSRPYCLPRRERPRLGRPERQAGGRGHSRGPCGRGKGTVPWEHSQLDTFDWEVLRGWTTSSVRASPWGSRRLGARASVLTRCPSARQALCVGKGQPSNQAPGARPERKEHVPEVLRRGVPQRREPGVTPPVPKLSANAQ